MIKRVELRTSDSGISSYRLTTYVEFKGDIFIKTLILRSRKVINSGDSEQKIYRRQNFQENIFRDRIIREKDFQGNLFGEKRHLGERHSVKRIRENARE